MGVPTKIDRRIHMHVTPVYDSGRTKHLLFMLLYLPGGHRVVHWAGTNS